MIDKKDREELQSFFDGRYKQIDDCETDRKAISDETKNVQLDVAAIKKSMETLVWLGKTALGALITGLVAAILAIVLK